jgi:hypothetical protein
VHAAIPSPLLAITSAVLLLVVTPHAFPCPYPHPPLLMATLSLALFVMHGLALTLLVGVLPLTKKWLP